MINTLNCSVKTTTTMCHESTATAMMKQLLNILSLKKVMSMSVYLTTGVMMCQGTAFMIWSDREFSLLKEHEMGYP